MMNTRSVSDHFLLGQSQPNLPQFQLPTNLDVLRCLVFLREQPGNCSTSFRKLVGCPFKPKTFDITCSAGACSVPEGCLLSKLKVLWGKAVVSIQRDDKIIKALETLYKLYKDIHKIRSSTKPCNTRKVDSFKLKLDVLFDIATSDAESLIENDPKITRDDVEEDLRFLMDQRSGRMMYLGENDTRYQNFVPYRVRVAQRLEAARIQEMDRLASSVPVISSLPFTSSSFPSTSSSISSTQIGIDPDFQLKLPVVVPNLFSS